MNPVLPLLVALSCLGLLVRRREQGLAWVAAGLAAVVLFWPALRLPDGIVSPAGNLAGIAPWQGTGDPADGNPILRDVSVQVQPWLLFLRDELRAGRLPYWNPFQYAGSPFWGNGSSAPLFPLHLLFVALPLQLGWTLLPWLRIVIAATGTWTLARDLELSRPAALLAAVGFPLSGMPVAHVEFPMGNALALLPWILLATERLAAGRWGIAPLALFGGLQLLAGHPETAVHTAIVTALYLAVRGPGTRGWLAAWERFLGGWAVAGAIAAAQLLPFAATLLESSRWAAAEAGGVDPPLALLLVQPLRFLLPDLYGDAAAGTWWGPFNDVATSVYVSALALPLAVAGAAAARRDRRRLVLLVLLLFSLLAGYHLPGVYDLLLLLPVAGRALHHRLLAVVDLALVLLAAGGLDAWVRGRARRGLLIGAALVWAALAVAWLLFHEEWARRDLLALEAGWTGWVAALAALAALASWLRPAWRLRLALVAPLLLAADLLVAHVGMHPGLSMARLYPETGAVRFLQDRPERFAATGSTLHPNAAMVYRIRDLRGDDSVKLARFESFYARVFGAGHPTYFRPPKRWPPGWLRRLGVRWLVTPPGGSPPLAGVYLAYDGPDARVWELPEPLPLARWAPVGAGEIEVREQVPGRWEIAWRATAPGRLVVAETYQRGWRATGGGRSLPVRPLHGLLLSVPVGPGEGVVVLEYRPPWITAGWALSTLGLVAAVYLLAAEGKRRRHPELGSDSKRP